MTFDVPESQAIDAGMYPAVLTGISIKVIEKGAYAGDSIRIWKFQADVNGTSEPIEASSSLNFGPKSKAYRWFTALVGRPPVPGEKGVELVGRACQLYLVVDEDSGYNKVADVLPASGPQKPAESVTAASGASSTTTANDPDWLPPLEEPPAHTREDLP